MKATPTLLLLGSVAVAGWGAYSALTPAPLPPRPAVTNTTEGRQLTPSALENIAGADAIPPAPAASPVTLAELNELRRALSRQQADIDELRRQLERQDLLLTDAIVFAATPATERRGTSVELTALAEAEIEQRRRAQADVIETAFAAEDLDQDWSTDATDALAAAFEHPELASALLFDLDCRATLCRVEVGSDAGLAADQLRLWLSVLTADTFGQISVDRWDSADGQTKAVAYLARNGYGLPGP